MTWLIIFQSCFVCKDGKQKLCTPAAREENVWGGRQSHGNAVCQFLHGTRIRLISAPGKTSRLKNRTTRHSTRATLKPLLGFRSSRSRELIKVSSDEAQRANLRRSGGRRSGKVLWLSQHSFSATLRQRWNAPSLFTLSLERLLAQKHRIFVLLKCFSPPKTGNSPGRQSQCKSLEIFVFSLLAYLLFFFF